MDRLEVAPERLRRRLDPTTLGFTSTEEVTPLLGAIHQERALDALEFGVGIDSRGYNLFVTGISGSGRTSMARAFLEQVAAAEPVPDDWAYVQNFEQPDRPIALSLPAGQGRTFATEMDDFVSQARRQISRAFETDQYVDRRQKIVGDLGQRRETLLDALDAFARERSFGVDVTPGGIIATPLAEGQRMKPEDLEQLSESDRRSLEQRGLQVQGQIGIAVRRMNELESEGVDLMSDLDREIAHAALEPLLQPLREKYSKSPAVVTHLARIADDIPGHLDNFRQQEPADRATAGPFQGTEASDYRNRYRVNVIVDNTGLTGAPVIVESNPTYYNLIGRIEYRATLGTLVTDFRQIKAGAVLRANGGYLILDASDVLGSPFAWPALIRALTNQEVRLENLTEQQSVLPTASLAPAPIPLRVKILLVGTSTVYQALFGLDEEFRELFKVRVDFAQEVDWNDERVAAYCGFIRRCVDERGLRHFDATGVARIIEEAARWRESQSKLSTRLRDLDDLVTEASYWAKLNGHALAGAEDVEKAIAEKSLRSSLAEERLRALITDGTIHIEIAGARVGQLNGLSVVELGDHRFGIPSRISATVAVGRGTMESIERETALGGPIHNKGFLIVTGYLAGRYAQRWPLSLRATLTFEQSYEGVEGDSASSAELYALLSALADVPLAQSIAVTGSVDQHGNVQAIGGVNDKIEGFFKVCQVQGLTGDQGVIIPSTNVTGLMLADEVVEAVRGGQFKIWAISNVDEGIEILTGLTAGEQATDGTYPDGSVHRRVAERLETYAKLRAALGPRV